MLLNISHTAIDKHISPTKTSQVILGRQKTNPQVEPQLGLPAQCSTVQQNSPPMLTAISLIFGISSGVPAPPAPGPTHAKTDSEERLLPAEAGPQQFQQLDILIFIFWKSLIRFRLINTSLWQYSNVNLLYKNIVQHQYTKKYICQYFLYTWRLKRL